MGPQNVKILGPQGPKFLKLWGPGGPKIGGPYSHMTPGEPGNEASIMLRITSLALSHKPSAHAYGWRLCYACSDPPTINYRQLV